MKAFFSLYTLKLPVYLVYMLQQVEYEPSKFRTWFWRVLKNGKSIRQVMHRQTLVKTMRAKLLLTKAYSIGLVLLLVPAWQAINGNTALGAWLFAAWVVIVPAAIVFGLWTAVTIAHKLVIVPEQKKRIAQAREIFTSHKGVKIAVLGSYGKTTLKEILNTVLSEGLKTAATPGNMNVSVSHAKFARSLNGDEQVLIVEFGEGAPGDVNRMAAMLRPDYAVVTGLAPNHLDHYGTLDDIAADLLSVYEHTDSAQVFVSAESAMLQKYLPRDAETYSARSVLGWEISDIKIAVDNLQFKMKKAGKTLLLKSGLIGSHQVAPIALAAAMAEKLGVPDGTIESGVAKTKPFDHRMQPRFMHGAWLIDDTYNGNLEGMQAGLKLLAALDAKRRWYVTPGLVDQGVETERVHRELGRAIADAKPDIVVLMENSVRPIIEASMKEHGFSGELRIETNPLEFYTSIEHLVASGDMVLMQNDWTDNYN